MYRVLLNLHSLGNISRFARLSLAVTVCVSVYFSLLFSSFRAVSARSTNQPSNKEHPSPATPLHTSLSRFLPVAGKSCTVNRPTVLQSMHHRCSLRTSTIPILLFSSSSSILRSLLFAAHISGSHSRGTRQHLGLSLMISASLRRNEIPVYFEKRQ